MIPDARRSLPAVLGLFIGILLATSPGAALASIALLAVLAALRKDLRPSPSQLRDRSLILLFTIGLGTWWLIGTVHAPGTAIAWADTVTWLVLALAAALGVLGPSRGSAAPSLMHVALGVVVGLFAMGAHSLIEVSTTQAARASGWAVHPNTWAAMAVVGAAAAAALAYGRRSVWILGVAFSFSAFIVVASGSRTAALGLGVALIVTALTRLATAAQRKRWIVIAATTVAFAAAMAVGTILFAPRLAGTWTALWSPSVSPGDANLVLASEEIGPPYWTLRTAEVDLVGGVADVAVHKVTATAADPLARVHQRIDLAPGETITLSVDVQGDHRPGIVGFSDPAGRIVVDAALGTQANSGPIEVVAVRTDTLGPWTRLHLTVRNEQASSVIWRFGLAPSLLGRAGAEAFFRRPAIVAGPDPAPTYTATTIDDRIRQLAAKSARQRLGYVTAALRVSLVSPWFGHGASEPFYDHVLRYAPAALAATDRPTHAHSLWLDTLVTRGWVGLAGLVLAIWSLAAATPATARARLLPLAAALLVLNTFDFTLWTPGGAIPAIATWLLVNQGAPHGANGGHADPDDSVTVSG